MGSETHGELRLTPRERTRTAGVGPALRVCMVTGYRPTPGGGGMEKHVYELATSLLQREVSVDVICEDRSFLPDDEHLLADHIIGIDPASLRAEGWVEQYREKSYRFAKVLDPNRYDIVHCHSHYGFNTALRLAREAQAPAVVTTYHLTPLGSLERFADLGMPEPDGAPIDRAVALMEETSAHLSDRCIAVSGGVAREVRDLYHVPEERVEVIHNWYNPSIFGPTDYQAARADLGLDADAAYLLYIGHFREARGKLLAEALELVSSDIKLIAVHPEAEESVEHSLRERILLPGYVPPERLALYYSAADAQCFPTVYGAFGLVLIEGMACGCPPIVFDFSAMNEIVTPESGYLVSEASAQAYAAAMQRAVTERPRKRAAAVKRADAFDMDMQIQRVLELYRSLELRTVDRRRARESSQLNVDGLTRGRVEADKAPIAARAAGT